MVSMMQSGLIGSGSVEVTRLIEYGFAGFLEVLYLFLVNNVFHVLKKILRIISSI